MTEALEQARAERARTIASALARTAEHHRQSALLGGVVALVGCVLAFVAEEPAAKAVALGLGILFSVFTYRSMRVSQSFVDPTSSPVLRAIMRSPGDIGAVTLDAARSQVRIVCGDVSLVVRLDRETSGDALLEALSTHAPNAEITRS